MRFLVYTFTCKSHNSFIVLACRHLHGTKQTTGYLERPGLLALFAESLQRALLYKKTITDVLATSAPKPGTPEDLQQLIEQFYKKTRSVIEMEEFKLPDHSFAKENDLTHTLSSYLREICPKWSKLSKNHKEKKSVLLLVVCSSALRTLELIKLTNAFKGDTKIMKLFAKHLKIKDQIKWLENNVIHLGVGTPERIKALIEQDGLSLQSLKYLVLDWNWRDKKQRRMVDIPEVKKSMVELLESGLIAVCRDGSVKIGLF
ncbi:protein CMSS1 isoform X4 [Dendrobates tinctorius]|uniref:protein CMSS1 isoform X4 n=1 Tax=Dendrobates tinctorius TaxID=92724 RepID=UPI003CC9CBD3